MKLLRKIRKATLLRPFRVRAFRLFWFGQTVSVLGDRVYFVALPFLVFDLGGSALQIGRILAAYSLPEVAFLLLGGISVDRLPRRALMFSADVFRAMLLILVISLFLTNRLFIEHLYLMAAGFGLCNAFFSPAAMSFIPEIIQKDALVSASSLRSIATEVSGIVGPLLAAFLINVGGVGFALGFDALTFLVGALSLLAIRVISNQKTSLMKNSSSKVINFWHELAQGFRLVVNSQWLWITISIFSIVNIFLGGTITILLPVLAYKNFGGTNALGWLLSSMALGSLMTALTLGSLGKVQRRGLTAYAGITSMGVAFIIIALSKSLFYGALGTMLLGASVILFSVIWESTLQELIPNEALGRVSSIDNFGAFALLPLGYLLVGAFVTEYGVSTVLLISGTATVLLSMIGFLVPGIRNLK